MANLRTAAIAAVLSMVAHNALAVERAPTPVPFMVEAQSLPTALNDWAQQAGLQVIWQPDSIARQLVTPRVAGTLDAESALKLLLQGSGFTYSFVDARTVAIRHEPTASTNRIAWSPADAQSTAERVLKLQPSAVLPDSNGDEAADAAGKNQDAQKPKSEEIVVTGTHIRGVTNSASPVQIYTRADIDLAGVGTVQDFMKRIPQNLANASEGTISNIIGAGNSSNAVFGAGVNLRGLGPDSTLVLLNGRRLAPGNTFGNFVDISMIPLAALERVDVITDGSSAIYGSDAVGGVVNYIMRTDFEGSETRARYGTVGNGGREEFSIGQTFGTKWDRGSALISYEYFDASALDAADRSYTSSARQPTKLLPSQERHGAFLSLNQDISPGLAIFADGTFSKRSSVGDASNAFISSRNSVDATSYSAALGGRMTLSRAAGFELGVSFADSDTEISNLNLLTSTTASSQAVTEIGAIDAKIDGALWAIDAGSVRYAIGGQYRDESFRRIGATPSLDLTRNVTAAFAELNIPIIGPRRTGGSEERLSLSLADRYERYSDFGSTNNPKVGLLWRPLESLKLRGTYGKSFQAPSLRLMVGDISSAVVIPVFDPLSPGALAGGTSCDFLAPTNTCTNVIEVFGASRGDLRPQRSTNWNFGFDWQPESVPGLLASVSYYHIKFDDRIADPTPSVDSLLVLRSENVLGSQIVQRNASASLVQQFATAPGFFNPLNIDLSTVGVIVDSRPQNLSIVNTSGIDVSVSSEADVAFGKLSIGVDATYILKLENRFTSVSPVVAIDNSPYNPIDLNARARIGLTHGPLTAALFVNYVDAYEDRRRTPIVPIASWTTADVTVQYQSAASAGFLSAASVAISVTNIADKDPPFVPNTGSFNTINYDGVNASALGRFFSAQLSKKF